MTEPLPEGRYANGFNVGYNAFEFIVDFSQHFAERHDSHVHSRIITSPPYAKLLLETLGESIGRYEQIYGAIPGTERNGETRGTEPGSGDPEPPAAVADDGSMNMPERFDPQKPRPTPPRDEPRYGRPDPTYRPPDPKTPPPGGYDRPQQEPPAYPPQPPPYSRPPRPYGDRPQDPYVPPPGPTGYGQHPEHPDPGHPHPDPGHPEHEPHYPEQPEEPTYGQTPTPQYGGHKPKPTYGEQETPAYGSPGGPAKPYDKDKYCPKPDDQIKTLQRALEEQNKKIQTLEKQRNSLKDDLSGLQQTATELSAVLTAYKEACKALRQDKSKLATYIQTKTPMVEAGIGDQRAAVEECMRGVNEWVEGWVNYAKQLKPKAKAAAQAAEAAAEEAAAAQATYDELKNSAKTLGDQLKALGELKDRVEDEDDKNKIARMYFLFRELQDGMTRVKLLTPEELEAELCRAWTVLNEAKEAARAAKAEADSMREAAERAATRAEDAKARRRDLTLQCIDRACPPPPPPTKPC